MIIFKLCIAVLLDVGKIPAHVNFINNTIIQKTTWLKDLPSHEYEVDMDKQEVLSKEEKASKTSAG